MRYIPRWFTISGTSRRCIRNWSWVRRSSPPPLTGGRSTVLRAAHSQPKPRQNRPPTTGVVRHSISFFLHRMIVYNGFLPFTRTVFLLRDFSSCRYRTRAIKQLFGSRLTAVSGFRSASKTCSWGCKFILGRHYFAKFLLGIVPRRTLATDNLLLGTGIYFSYLCGFALSLEMYRTCSQEIGTRMVTVLNL